MVKIRKPNLRADADKRVVRMNPNIDPGHILQIGMGFFASRRSAELGLKHPRVQTRGMADLSNK